MTTYVDQVLASLPSPIPAGGQFTVTEAKLFTDVSGGSPSTPYSYPLMTPSNVVGTPSQPYIPIALPAYVSTLYNNVFNINTNLENDILAAAADDRKYPTSYAVQQYVQSQLAGYQVINMVSPNNTYLVSTSLTNTYIKDVPVAATGYVYQLEGELGSNAIAMFWMDTTVNAPRNGASKQVMFGLPYYLKDASGAITNKLAFLYAGDDARFIHMGTPYKFYQFVIRGDCLSFVQAYDDEADSWNWIVTSSMGIFTNTLTIFNGSVEDQEGRVINQPTPDPPFV